MDKTIVGIDVSKNWLDVAAAGAAATVRIDNTPQAIAAWLTQVRPALVAFEPTGGYERALCAALRERAILFVRVHPNDVIAFRHSRGLKAKTDRIDAQLIAAFAAEELTRRGLRPTILGDEILRELAARRRQLAETLHAERCRAALATAPEVRASLQIVIDALAASLASIDQALAQRIAADPQTTALDGLLRSIQGIGPVTARTLIADLPELGRLNGKEIAALVGLAPITRQSGKTRFRERTAHGRTAVRNACSTPRAPPSAIHRRSRTSTTASSPTTSAPERSPSPPSCARSSSPPMPSLATSSRGGITSLDRVNGRWPD